MQRRRFLQTVAAAGALGLAGCSQGGAGSGGGTTTTPAAGDGGSGGTPSGDAGTTQAPTTTTATGYGSPSTPTPTQTRTTSEAPALGDMNVDFADNYRYRIDFSDYAQQPSDMAVTGEWHGSDYHSRVATGGETVDVWQVGGRIYVSSQGQCTAVPDSGSVPVADVDSGEWSDTSATEEQIQAWIDETASGTATIDGERMWVFAVDAGERGNEWSYTYYISAASGHLRRVETQGIVIEYWDWGAVPPISAPC